MDCLDININRRIHQPCAKHSGVELSGGKGILDLPSRQRSMSALDVAIAGGLIRNFQDGKVDWLRVNRKIKINLISAASKGGAGKFHSSIRRVYCFSDAARIDWMDLNWIFS